MLNALPSFFACFLSWLRMASRREVSQHMMLYHYLSDMLKYKIRNLVGTIAAEVTYKHEKFML